ncbi:hypothetical protein K431DRAFT_230064 [Polychaeton citri CBS 116435]|uniref:F-box domain-containing protein n=1 Tax=Polychaeton citri CBS 116435 TaxID=1314669 RepID=A0A9P4Q3C6_9PEZI|nr:hypothetical protein K431DRAFT_230064 [Polychaeton citri CBS 116435]
MSRVNADRELNDIPELPESVSHSILFELPREIRDRIYSFCLAAHDGLAVEWPKEKRKSGRQPQLLRVCKIIRDEAAPMLYTLNKLSFSHPSDANMFVRALSAPNFARFISLLELQIRATDNRLWMPYLTSTDDKRSLKADFPSVRTLCIRYKSNRWIHTLPPESNMRPWSEDIRLLEIMDGLRNVFRLADYAAIPPPPPPPPPQVHHGRLGPDGTPLGGIIGERDFLDYIDEKEDRKRQTSYGRVPSSLATRQPPPVIKITVSCRVHQNHFTALVTSADALRAQGSRPAPNGQTPTGPAEDAEHPMGAVREGDEFRGFTPVDLRRRMKGVDDPYVGAASLASTPFANNKGVLLALEIYCSESRRENPHQN